MSHHDKHSSHKSSSSKKSHSSSSSSNRNSDTHHHEDVKLHKLKGAKWKAFIKVTPKLYDADDDERSSNKKKHSNTVMRLDRNDMYLYGLFPETDQFVAVLCEICGATIKPQGFYKHIRNRHSSSHDPLQLSEKLQSPSSNLDNLMSNQNMSELQEILSNANLINASNVKQKHSKSSSSSSAAPKSSSNSSSKSSAGSSSARSNSKTPATVSASPSSKSSLSAAVVTSSNPPDFFNSSSSSNSLDSVALSVSVKQAQTQSSPVVSDPPKNLDSPDKKSIKSESHSSASKTSSSSKKNKRKAVDNRKVLPIKDREYDADKHCGVVSFETNNPCLRSLTCKSHALSLRRSVIGRSKSFDTLLSDHRTSHLPGKDVIDSNSNLSFDADFKGAALIKVASEPLVMSPTVADVFSKVGKTVEPSPSKSLPLLLKEKIKSDPELPSLSILVDPPAYVAPAVKQEAELDIEDTYTFVPENVEDFSETLETLGQQSKIKRDSQKLLLPTLTSAGISGLTAKEKEERLDENLQKLVQQKVQAKNEERERVQQQHQIVMQPSATSAADIIAQQFAEENPNTILTDATILMDPNTNVVQVSVSGTIKTSAEQNALEAVTQMTQNFNTTDPLTVTVPMSMLSVMTNIHMQPNEENVEQNDTNTEQQQQLHQLDDVSEFVGLDENDVVQANAFGTADWYATATGGTNDEMVATATGSEYSDVPLYFQFDEQAAMEDEQNRSLTEEYERNVAAVAAATARSGGEDIIYLPSDTFADTNMSINPHQILADSSFLTTTAGGSVVSANDSSQNSYSMMENHQQMAQQVAEMFEVDDRVNSLIAANTAPIQFSIAASTAPDTANLQLLTSITKPSKAEIAAAAAASLNNCSSSDEDNICCDLKTWYTSIPKPTTINTFGVKRVGGGVTTNRKMLAFRKLIINDKSYICSSPNTNYSSANHHRNNYNEIIISSINHKTQDFVQLTNGLQNNSHSLFVNKTTTPANRGRRFVSLTMTKKSPVTADTNNAGTVSSPTKYKKLLFQDSLFQSLLKSTETTRHQQISSTTSSSSSSAATNHLGQKRDHHEMNNHDIDNGFMLHTKRPKLNSMKSNRDIMLLSSSPPNSLMNNGSKPPSGNSNNGTTLSPVHQKLPRIF